MKCPCKDCEKKGCGSFHDSCENFKKWTASRQEANKIKWLEQDSRSMSRDHEIKYRKNLKQGRKKGA